MSAASVLVPTPQLASPGPLRVGGEERFSGAVLPGTLFRGPTAGEAPVDSRDYAAAVTQAREANRADTGSMASTQPAE